MEKNIKDPVKTENPTGFSVIVREFKKDKLALFSFFAVTIFIIAVFVASSFINLQQLQTVDIFRKYEVPSFNNFWNFFGRDSGGRSVMGYVIVGARNSITIGVIITIVTTFIGLFVGLCMGYYGGKVDALGMRIVDFISIMPSVMIIIVFVSIVPKYGIFQFILIFSMFYWTRTTRLARSKTLSETRRDYVNASKIGIEVALSFLGFGLPAATPSLGTLISYASKPEIIQYKAYVWLPAALVLLFMMLGINYIGQALRRAADAKQRLG